MPEPGEALGSLVVDVVPLQDRVLDVQRVSGGRNDRVNLRLPPEVLPADGDEDDHGQDDAEEQQGHAEPCADEGHNLDQVQIHGRRSAARTIATPSKVSDHDGFFFGTVC